MRQIQFIKLALRNKYIYDKKTYHHSSKWYRDAGTRLLSAYAMYKILRNGDDFDVPLFAVVAVGGPTGRSKGDVLPWPTVGSYFLSSTIRAGTFDLSSIPFFLKLLFLLCYICF